MRLDEADTAWLDEPDTAWRKSSHSGEGNCVEVALIQGRVAVRDSKDPGQVLTFSPQEWTDLLARSRAGELDLT
jgi:Domain of unknown function (DUF397)